MKKYKTIKKTAILFILHFINMSVQVYQPNYNKVTSDNIITRNVQDGYKSRIWQVEKARNNYYPYIAQVAIYNETLYSLRYCVGSIIGTKWILTARFCSDDGNKGYTLVYVGSELFLEGSVREVKEKHTKYVWFTGTLPYLLLELESALSYGEKIQPIKFGYKKDIVDGNFGVVVGYGDRVIRPPGSNITYSNFLQTIQLPILRYETCLETFPQYQCENTIPRTTDFCAGFEYRGSATCAGDNGAPFIVNNRLLGIAIIPGGCGRAHIPGVFACIAQAREWIYDVTGILHS